MSIKTTEDWWALAYETIPRLHPYALQHGVTFDTGEAMRMFYDERHAELHGVFEKLHVDLPDSPEIRHRPFFDLCDLCSEYWVFDLDAEQG